MLMLERRCAWRGIGFELTAAGLGDARRPRRARPLLPRRRPGPRPAALRQDLVDIKREALHAAAARGAVVLGICGGDPAARRPLRARRRARARHRPRRPGDASASDGSRLIGNVAIEVELRARRPARARGLREPRRAHDARRRRAAARPRAQGPRQRRPLGLRGRAAAAHVIGTYLHGPLLPKNAWFADWLLAAALGIEPDELAPLDDRSRTRRTRPRAAPPASDPPSRPARRCRAPRVAGAEVLRAQADVIDTRRCSDFVRWERSPE